MLGRLIFIISSSNSHFFKLMNIDGSSSLLHIFTVKSVRTYLEWKFISEMKIK